MDRLYCGIDLGASATKVVLLDGAGQLVVSAVQPSGIDYSEAAHAALALALDRAGVALPAIARTVATGYGRDSAPADRVLTEIRCQAVGCHSLFPRPITILDIGGQDSKIIRLDGEGRQLHFRMNRQCAAGTGAFLEEIAARLSLPVEKLEELARGTSDPVRLSSFCTVLAKTEILSHLRRGVTAASLVRGAFLAVVDRARELDPLEGEVVLTGGVAAHNPTVAALLGEALERPVTVPPEPQLTGALGAALLARAEGDAP